MKTKKNNSQLQKNKTISEMGDQIRQGKKTKSKVKYKHKNYWLDQESDDDYELPKYEEE